jgi:hemerythrin
MALIEWTNSYSVGLPDFDKHHRHLFDLLNKAYEASLKTGQKDVFFEILEELSEYSQYHFATEEKLMGRSFYPGLAEHQKEHALFTDKITELLNLKSKNTFDCMLDLVELTQFLMEWFSHHILEVDKQYSELLAGGA